MSHQCVYFIQADENGPIKIGYTSRDPKHRLNQLQTASSSPLKLIGSIKGGTVAIERELHSRLAEWRLQGEWFEAHPTVLSTIEAELAESREMVLGCIHCSFCFRCQHDLDDDIDLVAGPAANICSECLEWATDAMTAHKAAAS